MPPKVPLLGFLSSHGNTRQVHFVTIAAEGESHPEEVLAAHAPIARERERERERACARTHTHTHIETAHTHTHTYTETLFTCRHRQYEIHTLPRLTCHHLSWGDSVRRTAASHIHRICGLPAHVASFMCLSSSVNLMCCWCLSSKRPYPTSREKIPTSPSIFLYQSKVTFGKTNNGDRAKALPRIFPELSASVLPEAVAS